MPTGDPVHRRAWTEGLGDQPALVVLRPTPACLPSVNLDHPLAPAPRLTTPHQTRRSGDPPRSLRPRKAAPAGRIHGTGRTIDFLLTATRDKKAAKRFFRRALARENVRHPRIVVTDRLKSYPGALREMKREGELGRFVQHRRGRWLNNLVEQDHRRIKRRTGPMLGFQSFWTARRTLAGVEAMAMLAKGQGRAVPGNDMSAQRSFVHQLFGLAA